MRISTKNQRSVTRSIVTFGATVIGFLVYQNVSQIADLLDSMTYWLGGADGPTSSSCDVSKTTAATTTTEDKYAMALEESFGFFDNIHQDDWEVMRNITLRRINNDHKSNPLFDSDRPNVWYQNNWEPDFSCRHDTKVGMGADGGKVRTSTKHFFLPRVEVETARARSFSWMTQETSFFIFSPNPTHIFLSALVYTFHIAT